METVGCNSKSTTAICTTYQHHKCRTQYYNCYDGSIFKKADNFDPFIWHQHYYINPSYRRLLESKQVNETKQFLLKLMVSNNSQGIQIPQNLNIEHEKSINEVHLTEKLMSHL